MKRSHESPTVELLRERFIYDHVTGRLVWRFAAQKGRIAAGTEVGRINRHGYRTVSLGRTSYSAHRIAWAIHFGAWPAQTIDHINGDKLDNRIVNLRDVPTRINVQNRHAPCTNRNGLAGVRSQRKRFSACIQHYGKSIYLGLFLTREAAHAAYVAAKRELHEGCTL